MHGHTVRYDHRLVYEIHRCLSCQHAIEDEVPAIEACPNYAAIRVLSEFVHPRGDPHEVHQLQELSTRGISILLLNLGGREGDIGNQTILKPSRSKWLACGHKLDSEGTDSKPAAMLRQTRPQGCT